jgi:ribose transport system ATP-binding protein
MNVSATEDLLEPVILRIEHLSKYFGGTAALDDVSLEIRAGEIHGLVGQNGSGKSTLIKCLSGYHAPDSEWTLTIGDRSVSRALRPGEIRDFGISFVHQDLGVLPDLTVLENLILIQIASDRRPFISWKKERKHARDLFEAFGLDLNTRAQLSTLSPVEQAQVAVIRAVMQLQEPTGRSVGYGGVLVLDEAATFLDQAGRQSLYVLLRSIVARGVGVLFVSHDVKEVLEITDRITVFRDGKLIETVSSSDVDHDDVVGLIIGGHRSVKLESIMAGSAETLEASVDPRITVNKRGSSSRPIDKLDVSGLNGEHVQDVEFQANGGEIVGITGIVGSGWESVLGHLYGASRADSGVLTIDGQRLNLRDMTPVNAIDLGMVLVPSDRLAQGIVGELSVQENVMLPVLSNMFSRGRLQLGQMTARCADLLLKNNVQPPVPNMPIGRLSGGNQQKAVFGKWLQLGPRLILLNEPTQGVDVGARQRIFATVRAMAADGAIVLYASGDWEEVVNIADRVVVFANGKVCAELAHPDLSLDSIALSAYQSTRRSADLGNVSLVWESQRP